MCDHTFEAILIFVIYISIDSTTNLGKHFIILREFCEEKNGSFVEIRIVTLF